MAKGYEGSAKDRAQDARGARATGMSKKAYESSARDQAEDAAGQRGIKVKPHMRRPPGTRQSAPPTVGPNEFDAGQEQAMRQGQAQANQAAMPPGGDDDMGGMGGM